MRKVTAFIGTQAKKATYQALQEFERGLKQYDEIDFEYVFLSDYHLEYCRGCLACFIKGEEHCPLKDDRDVLLDKIERSDGIVLATPNYAFTVSVRMKNLLDRLAYVHHRPRFFGKACTPIVVQGIYGGSDILKYLSMVSESMSFHVSKGCCVTTLRPMTKNQQEKLVVETRKAAARFHRELLRPALTPSFFRLMLFRLSRTNIKALDTTFRDYQYYRDKGWFEADYYYPTSIGLAKRAFGSLFDFIGRQMVKRQ
jgi:multimeric flavodoxin WrbA